MSILRFDLIHRTIARGIPTDISLKWKQTSGELDECAGGNRGFEAKTTGIRLYKLTWSRDATKPKGKAYEAVRDLHIDH